MLPEADLELGYPQGTVTGSERDPSIVSTYLTPPTLHTSETSSERNHREVPPKEQYLSRPSGESLGSQQTLNDEPACKAPHESINIETTLSSTMFLPPSGARPVIG